MNIRVKISQKMIEYLRKKEVPWKTQWQGAGINIGVPRNVANGRKYFGINIMLLRIAGYKNQWWGTQEDFGYAKLNGTPISIINYINNGRTVLEPLEVYNAEQLDVPRSNLEVTRRYMLPCYGLASKVLHGTPAEIRYNDEGKCQFWYEDDYISIPKLEYFENGIGGPQSFWESLAHELLHFTEKPLHISRTTPEYIIELRAEMGAAYMMAELGIPHSISYLNYKKFREEWIQAIKNDAHLISQIAASACEGVDYILSFSKMLEIRHNQVNQYVA